MRLHARLTAIAATALVAVLCAATGTAVAAFPNFSGCPTSNPDLSGCINVQSQSGSMVIKGFAVPLGNSLEIRGGILDDGTFVAPPGTNGFFAQPVDVPGGLLGIELPIFLNDVTATAELAGPPSSIRLDPNTASIRMPLKVRLSNPLIGPNCHIGTDSNPVLVSLITGTTSPPPPNRPISGRLGTFTFIPPATVTGIGNLNVDNSYAIPGASSCGLGLGLINTLINAKLRLPSAAGNNELQIVNDIAVELH